MHKTIGCYVAFREARGIAESVRSAAPWIDELIIYSAPFHAAMGRPDETVRIALEASGDRPAWWREAGPTSEVDARNAVLAMARARGGTRALVLDGDEVLLAESTAVEATSLYAAIRSPHLSEGIAIYTTALLFHGHAPDISEEAYSQLPIVSSRGVQPRIFDLAEAEYRASEKGAPGLYVRGKPQRPSAAPGAVIVNSRHRQSWADYQADYAWERSLEVPR